MDAERVESIIEEVIEEIFRFVRYSPRDKLELVTFLFTAQHIAEVYDDMVDEPYGDENYRMALLIKQYLSEYPYYRLPPKDDELLPCS